MYIFELISKIKNNFKNKKQSQEEIEYEACSHSFAPLDSTKKYFACTKCGEVIEAEELKAKNFFIQEN